MKKKIIVLVDRTVSSKGVPARSCFWDEVLSTNLPEKLSISDSREQLRDRSDQEVVRIDVADIVIVNWDAANGDYACGSDDVFLYFLTRQDRRTALLTSGGTLLCEFQSGKGVLHQGAYNAIFGDDEVAVFKANLHQGRKIPTDDIVREQQNRNEANSHGPKAEKLYRYRNHPIVNELPEVMRSEYVETGDPIFNHSERFTEFKAYKHRASQLWRGWFENWKKGWVPLLVAVPQSEPSQFERWFRLPPAILLAKSDGGGLMLASTMWIAGARCQMLVDRIVKADINEIRKAHDGIRILRNAKDLLALIVIAVVYAWVLWEFIAVNPPEHTRLGRFLIGVQDVGFTWLALIAFRFWWHFFWNRPYGANIFQFARFAWKSFRETL